MQHNKSWEQEAVDEIIAEEIQECLDVQYSPSGLCPCCGSLLGEMAFKGSFSRYYFQLCNECGWESRTVHDV